MSAPEITREDVNIYWNDVKLYNSTMISQPVSPACVWLQEDRDDERWISLSCDRRGDCLGWTRQQAVTITYTHSEQLQINSLQQQPLSSPAATRSASTRNQPANSFPSELWGGGGGGGWGRDGTGDFVASMLWLWCCVIDRYVWIQCLMHTSQRPFPSWSWTISMFASRNVMIHAKMTGQCRDEGVIHRIKHIIDPIHVWSKDEKVQQVL